MANSNNKLIYHIFWGNVPFHVINMLKSFISNFGHFSFFIIAGASEENKTIYEDVFSSFDFHNYKIIMEDSGHEKYSFLKKYLLKRKLSNSYDGELLDFMRNVSNKSAFLIHGLSSRWLNVLMHTYRFKNVNWVCWGCWYYNKSKSAHALIVNNIDRLNYNIYKKIICLMPQDIRDLKKQLKINADFFYIPYPGVNRELVDFALDCDHNDKHEKIRVLLGNSGHAIYEYEQFLRSLKSIESFYEITCMVSYGASNRQIDSFLSTFSHYIEQGNISLLTEMLSKKDYAIMLNSFDVYLSPVNTQTGLAAIYLCMNIGKKIYLQGNNYDYIKQLGGIVSHTSQFEADIKSKNVYLNDGERKINNEVVTTLLDPNLVIPKWNMFFNQIL